MTTRRWNGIGGVRTPRALWSELDRRSPVLARTAAFHVLMLLVTIVLFAVDSREVMGLNAWIKPMKFMASIAIYLATLAWLIGYLERPRWAVRTIAWGVSACMVVETTLILLQAARGVRSHFNDASPFDSAVFAVMGVGVIVDTLLMLLFLVLFLCGRHGLAGPYLWGIRLGILVFLVGAIVGGWMSAHGGHTVGAPDGGAGLPFVNWSVRAGDLRIAHALGLHGLQLLPFVGFLISWRGDCKAGSGVRSTLVVVFGVLYGLATLALFLLAMQGVPITGVAPTIAT